MRDIWRCDKCYHWNSYYEDDCTWCNRPDSRDDFLNKYNIKNGDEVEFINGLVTKFDTHSFGAGSSFNVITEKTYPRRNFMMVHINQVVSDLDRYKVVRVNENFINT